MFLPLSIYGQDSKKVFSSRNFSLRETGNKFAPNQLLVQFKDSPQVVYDQEVSFSLPILRQKVLVRRAGWAVKGMSGVTKLNKNYRVGSVQKLGDRGVMGKMVQIYLPEGTDLASAMSDYFQDKDVVSVEPNYFTQAAWIPNDPYFSQNPLDFYQWNLGQINMPLAWDYQPRGGASPIIVAVIDTGIAFQNSGSYHQAPELAQVPFVAPQNFNSTVSCPVTCDDGTDGDPYDDDCTYAPTPFPPNSQAFDDNGHGTHVAGTIAQRTDNATHAAGIAFNVSLMPVKVLNHCGSGTATDIIRGINYIVSYLSTNPGKKVVVNMSLTVSGDSGFLHQAIQDAVTGGAVVVAASGNNGSSSVSYPAVYPEVIAVGATRLAKTGAVYNNLRANYSQYGPGLDIVAPGGQTINDSFNAFLDVNNDLLPDGIVQQTIYPTDFTRFTQVKSGLHPVFGLQCIKEIQTDQGTGYMIDDECGVYQGTSMATPHVSAAVALMLSINPNLNPDSIVSMLKNTASKSLIPGYNQNEHGAGLLDVAAVLGQVMTTVTSTPTPSLTPTLSPTPISTPTTTPVHSPTPTPTSGLTPTPTATKTPTPSITITPTQSISPTPSTTPTSTPVLTPTVTPTPTITPSPTQTPTPTPTPDPDHPNLRINLKLQNRNNHSCEIELKIYSADKQEIYALDNLEINQDGLSSSFVLPADESLVNVSVWIKELTHLSKVISDVNLDRGVVTSLDFDNLLAGDVASNNKVDIYDYSRLVEDFGLTEQTAADLDGDGEVDIYDYALLVENFGQVGQVIVPSLTPTPVLTPTPTPTPTLTPTPSVSPTPTATLTLTPTPTQVLTPSPTITIVPTLSPTPTPV